MTDPAFLQWAVGILAGIVMFLLGGAFGNFLAGVRISKHESLEGHPRTIARLDEHDKDIKELRSMLIRIEAKLDRVIERQAGRAT